MAGEGAEAVCSIGSRGRGREAGGRRGEACTTDSRGRGREVGEGEVVCMLHGDMGLVESPLCFAISNLVQAVHGGAGVSAAHARWGGGLGMRYSWERHCVRST